MLCFHCVPAVVWVFVYCVLGYYKKLLEGEELPCVDLESFVRGGV